MLSANNVDDLLNQLGKNNGKVLLEYPEETNNDKILNEIKNICFEYLEEESLVDNISTDNFLLFYEFLLEQYKVIDSLMVSFAMDETFNPLTEVHMQLDTITLNGLEAKSQTLAIDELHSKVNSTLELISFCYGVISRILKEREIN